MNCDLTGNRELFSNKSDDYAKYRPSYPDAAVDWLKSKVPCGNVLDVGAGTGIFTAALLRRFKRVSAVEPNEDMRREFSGFLPGIVCSGGSGEDTGFPGNSFALITVAQAFHWLDAEKFKSEAVRILETHGKVAIVWNNSLNCDFTAERNRVCQKYCPRFRSGHAGKRTAAEGDAFLRNGYFREVEVVSFDNPFAMTLLVFEGNVRSRSYALAPGEREYSGFTAELRAVFERHAKNGVVIEPQETQIYLGSF